MRFSIQDEPLGVNPTPQSEREGESIQVGCSSLKKVGLDSRRNDRAMQRRADKWDVRLLQNPTIF
jgi:hypothetical protein